MRRVALFLLFFSSLLTDVYGIYASQAHVIDWHEPRIGIPLTSNPETAPRIHRVPSADRALPQQAVFLSASKANVISGLNPTEGNIGMVPIGFVHVHY